MVAKTKPAAPVAVARPRACGGCIHIDTSNPSDVVCRRYPPTILPVATGGIRGYVPNVSPTHDTCGEFFERKAEA